MGVYMSEQLVQIMSEFQRKRSELIPILQKVQSEIGYLSEDAMRSIAAYTREPESRVYAVATFYAQFRFTPAGKNKVSVCKGTACHVRGAARILDEVEKRLDIRDGETSSDMEYSLETVACIGACGVSPCIMINDKVEARLTPKKIADLLK
jgi:NADH-quinone oxidoreductase subunit E